MAWYALGEISGKGAQLRLFFEPALDQGTYVKKRPASDPTFPFVGRTLVQFRGSPEVSGSLILLQS